VIHHARWLSLAAWLTGFLFARGAEANGISFYQRIAVVKEGKLSFVEAKPSALPASNRAILVCARKGVRQAAKCASGALAALKREAAQVHEPNLQAWKRFLAGTVQFQVHHFDEAVTALKQADGLAQDSALKLAIRHRLLGVYRAKAEMKSLLQLLAEIRRASPAYKHMDRIFDTYPEDLCNVAWHECNVPTDIATLQSARPVMERIATLQGKVRTLPVAKDVQALVPSALELARSYEKFCPMATIYQVVCPAALEIYGLVQQRAPNASGADLAFLRMQESKLAYEYEGDDVTEAKDHLAAYAPFLKRYPTSKLAPEIRRRCEKATQRLARQRGK
jgi:hypothetical protein